MAHVVVGCSLALRLQGLPPGSRDGGSRARHLAAEPRGQGRSLDQDRTRVAGERECAHAFSLDVLQPWRNGDRLRQIARLVDVDDAIREAPFPDAVQGTFARAEGFAE